MFDFHIIPVADASVVTLMKSINRVIINPVIFLMFAVAMVYFLYGVTQYLVSPGNEEVRKKSKSVMMYGIIGLFIMVAVFGIMRLITGTLGVTNVKIQNSGDYSVETYNVSGGQKQYSIDQGALNDPSKVNSKSVDATKGETDISSDKFAETPDKGFAVSPFTTKFVESPQCWHRELSAEGVTEYKALKAIQPKARALFVKETGLTNSDPNYPVPFQTKTLYDKTNKIYYVWWDARAPLSGGTAESCKLLVIPPQEKLSEYENRSSKTSSLTGKYTSDTNTYRVVDSGVDKVLTTAREIALRNALTQVAKLKGLNTITGMTYTILEEKYFAQDAVTGNYDFWIAIEVKK